MRNTKLGCMHLRNVLRHRLCAWDESFKAEEQFEQDIDSSSDAVDYTLSFILQSQVDDMPDEAIMALFNISPVQEKV